MAKRRITQQQTQRIESMQAKRLAAAQYEPEQTGLLIAHHGTRVIVETTRGKQYTCSLRQHLGPLVTGDKVILQSIKNETTGIVTALVPRQNALVRPNERGVLKPIAANIDRMILVITPEPLPIRTLLDSYLVAAENCHIEVMIIINKIDLLNKENAICLNEIRSIYEAIDYPIITSSTMMQVGIMELQKELKNKTSIFVGQSGVGKSSLINLLEPHIDIPTSPLSAQLGTHTTTTTQLYHFAHGGHLIDSPGIRQFGLWNMTREQILNGFKELVILKNRCKFRNCEHVGEQGCALIDAVKTGKIANTRLQSYHALLKRYT